MKKSLFFILLCNLILNDLLTIKIEVEYKNEVEIKVDGLKVVDINSAAPLIQKLNRAFSLCGNKLDYLKKTIDNRNLLFILAAEKSPKPEKSPKKFTIASIFIYNETAIISCENSDLLSLDYKIVVPQNEANNCIKIFNLRSLDKERRANEIEKIKELPTLDRPNIIYNNINGTMRQMPKGFFQVAVLVEESDDQELKKDFYLKQKIFDYENLHQTPLKDFFDITFIKEEDLEQYRALLEKIHSYVCLEDKIYDEESLLKWAKDNNIDLKNIE